MASRSTHFDDFSLTGGHWSDLTFGIEDTQVDQPSGRIEFRVDGVDAIVVDVAFLGGLGLEDHEAWNGLLEMRSVMCHYTVKGGDYDSRWRQPL